VSRTADPHYTVLMDTRENYPVLIPTTMMWRPDPRKSPVLLEIRTVERALKWGDITVEGYETVVTIECKRKLSELAANLWSPSDRGRASRAFNSLARNCKFPYLFLDMTWDQFMYKPAPHETRGYKEPFLVHDRLVQEMQARGIKLLGPIASNRSKKIRGLTGEWLLRIMLGHISPRMGSEIMDESSI